MSLITPGVYQAELLEVEGITTRHKCMLAVKLKMRTVEEVFVEEESSNGEILRSSIRVNFFIYILGSWQHISAWRRVIGQTFEVRIKHEKREDHIYINAELLQ